MKAYRDEFDTLISEQKSRYEQHLRFSVESALTYTCTESSADDWIDFPEKPVQLIVELQRHVKAINEHLKAESLLETVASCRSYTEDRFDRNELNHENHKTATSEKFEQLDQRDLELNQYVGNVESINADFRQKYSEEMATNNITDLIPGLTQADTSPDTEDFVVSIDQTVNPRAGEARMFTLRQIHDLFNVLLKRSNVQARLTREEEKTRVLEEKVAELEAWRPDLE